MIHHIGSKQQIIFIDEIKSQSPKLITKLLLIIINYSMFLAAKDYHYLIDLIHIQLIPIILLIETLLIKNTRVGISRIKLDPKLEIEAKVYTCQNMMLLAR